ncbi:unnamed protein product [Mytilus coruscus]|uniref:Uncharacterized protein n=1 Tax=Mytilus coruscus TaxID=42192 RepID=A0A6J8EZ47_MYTCO|nr:unnamed protein product [Mytilus coruscus]
MCYCNMNEECDHVKGCLKVSPSTEAVTKDDNAEGTSTALETTEEIKSKTGKDKSQIPISSIISTVLILLLCVALLWVFWKHEVLLKKRDKNTDRSNTIHSNVSANQSQLGETHENGEVEDGILPCSVQSNTDTSLIHAQETSFIHTQENTAYFIKPESIV